MNEAQRQILDFMKSLGLPAHVIEDTAEYFVETNDTPDYVEVKKTTTHKFIPVKGGGSLERVNLTTKRKKQMVDCITGSDKTPKDVEGWQEFVKFLGK